MGDLVDLANARAERARVYEDLAVMHPALRWVAGSAWWVAHRRTLAGSTACGAAGSLILAPPGVPLCPDCYPRSGDAEAR